MEEQHQVTISNPPSKASSQTSGDEQPSRPPRHRSCSILSNRTNTTWRSDVYGRPRIPRGAMVYTGPDSLRMHRQRVLNPDYTGEGEWTPERTSSVSYITRGPASAPHPRPKSAFSGAIGWGAWGETALLCSALDSGHQIKLKTFRQQLEDSASHRFQEPWYAPPKSASSHSSTSRPATSRLLSRDRM